MLNQLLSEARALVGNLAHGKVKAEPVVVGTWVVAIGEAVAGAPSWSAAVTAVTGLVLRHFVTPASSA